MAEAAILESPHKVKGRNQINNLIFVIYLLLIFEGAIRKWVLPGLSSPLFFIKDPFLILVYVLCIYHKLLPKNGYFLVSIILAFAFYILASFQSLIFQFPIIVGLFGWRNYVFYLPLAFIIGDLYSKEDLIKVAKVTCLLAIPIAILTYIQYLSPKDAYINKNVGYENTNIFTVVDGIVRPSGTFSFTTGHATFVMSLPVMLLFNFLVPSKERFLSPIMFIICIFAFFTNLAVCGSRGAFVGVGIIIVFFAFSSLFIINNKRGINILITLIFALIISTLVFNFLFDKELAMILKRQEMAQASEGSIFNRMMSIVFDASFLFMSDISLVGFGLGISSGGGSFLANGARSFVLAETEWSRNILEAGLLLGGIYIFYRTVLCIQLFIKSAKAILRTKSPIPFVFFGFTFPMLFSGPITGNGSANVYNWIFVGFCFAAAKVYNKKTD